MERETTTLEVAGRRIHEIRGGSGRPLLYLHSAGGEALWLPHLVALAEHFELHAPAHPGFLGSEGIGEIREVRDYAEHYFDYLDAMGWEAIDVVGLSLGGWIGAEMAATHPERVRSLVLTGAVGIWIRERPIADLFALDTRFPERLRRLLFHDPEHPMARMFRSPGEDEELPEEQVVHFLTAMAATARVGWNPLLHDPRLEGRLHRITARTLCLWGDDDRVVPPAYGEKYAKLVPGAELRIVPACGHMVPLEKTHEWVAAVREFVEREGTGR